jgi:hypothetical protein
VGSAAVLESGQEERLFTDSDFPRLEIEQDENNGDKSWWCIGYIAYRDQNNINRVTGFCRKWNVITKNWDILEILAPKLVSYRPTPFSLPRTFLDRRQWAIRIGDRESVIEPLERRSGQYANQDIGHPNIARTSLSVTNSVIGSGIVRRKRLSPGGDCIIPMTQRPSETTNVRLAPLLWFPRARRLSQSSTDATPKSNSAT